MIFRIKGESTVRVLGATQIDVETDSTAAIGMDSRTSVERPDTKSWNALTRHVWMLTRERELEIPQFRRPLQHPQQLYGYKSATPLEIAWNALVRGKPDTDLRLIVTWDVASVTNLMVHADTLAGANIEVRPDKSERNTLCQVRRLNTVAPTKGVPL